jgi:hypothetical protein
MLQARAQVFRYCIFGHDMPPTGVDAQGNPIYRSGRAETGGDDLFISLGTFPAQVNDANGQFSDAEWADVAAGTFMHELGHTFRLNHGGGIGLRETQNATLDEAHQCLDANNNYKNSCISYKPNYLSVMNYLYQFNEDGYAVMGVPGVPVNTSARTNRPLDYSPTPLATLNKNSLNENLGVGGPPYRILFGGPFKDGGQQIPGSELIGPANGPVDWNNNGRFEAGIAAQINTLTNEMDTPAALAIATLQGHDDWSNLVYSFRGWYLENVANGSDIPQDSPQPELTVTDYFITTHAGVLGDLNHDGLVNCADIAIVKASFGKKTGDPGFDPRADVNGDGVVDIRDLAIVSQFLPAGTVCK